MCLAVHRDECPSFRALPQYARLSHHKRRRLQGIGTLIDVEEGRELVSEGQVGGEAFLTVAGRARVTHDDETVGELQPGDVFGELAVLGKTRRNATVTAASPMTVLVLTPPELFELLDDYPIFAQQIREAAAARSR